MESGLVCASDGILFAARDDTCCVTRKQSRSLMFTLFAFGVFV